MKAPKPVRRRVAIAGFVIDSATGKALTGINISISDAPEKYIQKLALIGLQFGAAWNTKFDRPDKTKTRQDGSFYFLDLPAGTYAILASPPRPGTNYGTAKATLDVVQDAEDTFKLNWTILSLPSTVLTGTVSSNKKGVNYAAVRIVGSGECAFTDDQGRYRIAGLEPGKRTVLVNAQGFAAASQCVLIAAPGDTPVLDFKLSRNPG